MDRETQTLIRSICHDLRAPIRAIREECHRSSCSGRHRDVVDSALDQMSGILDDLHAYIHTGVNGGAEEAVDLTEVVHLAMASTPDVKSLTVVLDYLPVIRGYKVQLVRLFQNLFSNAVKFAGPEATVTIEAEQTGEWWTINFCDDGPGIPPDQREAVFKPMHRLHGWWDVPGSGLGLAACRQVTGLHGGDIVACDAPGGGACFKITLPVE